MTLDEKAVGAGIVMLAYGMTGLLPMIPAIQEIGLDRKLNEDKTRLEKNGFHPDLVARHVRSNEAVFIGCGQDTLDSVRQGLTQGGVPFITITSNMIEDKSKRPPYFYTVIIRDIDRQRAAELLRDLLQEQGRGEQGYEEELEEEDLEREIGGQEDAIAGGEKNSQQEDGGEFWQEEDDQDWEEEEGEEDSSRDDKKKAAAKKKAEKRKERCRAEERKHQDDKRHEDALRRNNDRSHEQAPVPPELSYDNDGPGYQEAYAIRAGAIEAQCERYAKAELMRRELERMRLFGEEMSDAYSCLKDQYRSMNDEIQAYHDNFQSIGKGGWKEYAAEAAKRARTASVEDLKERTWDIPNSNDYLRQNQDGSYSAYSREEKKAYLDRRYQGGETNIILNGYAEDAIWHEALRRQEELIQAREKTGTQDGIEQYRKLLGKYDVTDQEVSKYNSWDSVRREKEIAKRKLEEIEKRLEDQGYTGVREYRKKLEDALKDTATRVLDGQAGYWVQAAPDPSVSIKGPDGKPSIDFRDRKFSRPAYESLQEEGQEHSREKPPIVFSRASGEDVPLRQIANGYTLTRINRKRFCNSSTFQVQ